MNQRENFEKFLLDSFGDGVFSRELRLSSEELSYLKELYPKASVTTSTNGKSKDGKEWYIVNILASRDGKTKKPKQVIEIEGKVHV